MTLKNLVHPRKTNPQIQECSVSELLRITLQVSRLLGPVPARLRRAGGGWRLVAVPSRLTHYQLLFVIVPGGIFLYGIFLDLMEKNPERRLYLGTTALTGFISCTDQALLLVSHLFCELYSMDKMMSLVSILQHLEKMNISLRSDWYSIKYQRIKITLLIYFMAWTFLSIAVYDFWSLYMNLNDDRKNHAGFYAFFMNGYQYMVITMFQLRWSITIAEISSTLAALNSKIRQLLQHNTADPEDLQFTIGSLGEYYETICDIARQIEKDNGMFFLFIFISKFTKLIVTPYNLLSSLGTVDETESRTTL